jgi:uncharacterized protein
MMRALFFFSLLGTMVLGNLAWWRAAYVAAAKLKYRRMIRIVAGLWAGTMFAVLLILILSRRTWPELMVMVPTGVLAAVYIWHFLFVLPWVVWRAVRNSALATRWIVRRLRTHRPTDIEPAPLTSRRQFLAGAAMMAPPMIATLAAWRGVSQLDDFRINRQRLLIPNLPPALQGLTIAHVTDVHIGKYTDNAVLRKIVEQTNQLRPDLVLLTGDLIDFNLADLPAGLDMIARLDPSYGLAMCEGNHDLFQGRARFGQMIADAGVPLPINSSHSVTINGQEVQLLGLRWGPPQGMDRMMATSEQQIELSMRVLRPQVREGAFPILLAHHPHAFDYIGDANIPLTLAGHTHGGQINPLPGLFPAQLRFRYISGVYERPGRKLVVSNGVGNWFPLRVNAPAEIVHITLERA